MSNKSDEFKVENYPMMVSFDVTGKCNFKCLHCYNDSGKPNENELSDEEALEVAKQIVEIKPLTMCVCGGEPTLRRNLYEIIETISKAGILVNMVSNGSLLNREKLINLKKAGLDTLQISLDGCTAMMHDTFRGYVGSFEKATEIIKIGNEIGLNMMTATTPSKLNFKHMEEHFEFCYKLGLKSVRIMPLIPMGRGSKINQLLLSSEEYYQLQLLIEAKKRHYMSLGMILEWGDPLDHYARMPENAKSGFKTANVDIKSNGNLSVSPYIPIVVGNLREHTLKEYWDNGYKDIWGNIEVVNYVKNIKNIYDINQMEHNLYSGDTYYIKIM